MSTAKDFLSSIGVNTHVDATTTPYGNVGLVAKDLAYLGVTRIRDHAWDTDLPAYRTLASKGIKFDLIVDDEPKAAVAAMIPIKSSILSFEGSNEVDINPVTVAGVRNKISAAIAEQKALYNAVKSTPSLSAIPVINQSVGDPSNYARYAGTITYSDIINIHAYAAWGDTPQLVVPDRIRAVSSATKPSVITETGYFTLLHNDEDPSGVTESVQARLTLDTLFDNFSMGVTQSYLYELLDEGEDPAGTDSELHYGLFHADGTPKLAATAIHNLTSILSMPGSGKNPTISPKFTVAGLPDTGRSLSLTGSDGSAFLAVWAEPKIWDTDAQAEISAPASHVTVNLGATASSVKVFDPMAGANPIATYTNVSKVVLNVTDHPLIIQAAGSSNVPSPPTPSPRPSGASASALAADALIAPAGSTIIDGENAPVLIGDPVTTASFFVHAAARQTAASTIVNLHAGDTVTLWGFTDGVSTLSWKANQTVNGYTGATLHSELAGAGAGARATLTLAGLSMHDVRTKLEVSTGTANGTNYLRLTDLG